MIKNSKKNQLDDKNILYLHESDAKALGIVEGGVQRVFVDGREVDVTFVDEHEIIPMSAEEKKIYDEAEKLANKYIAEAKSMSKSERYNKEQTKQMIKKERDARRSANLDFFSRFWLSNKKTEVAHEDMDSESKKRASLLAEKAQHEVELEQKTLKRRQEIDEEYRQKEQKAVSARELRALKREHRLERKMAEEERRQAEQSRKHRFNVRSDIFTEEELEILQGIISKTKGGNGQRSSRNSQENIRNVATKNRKKVKKIKTKKRR